MPGILYVVATPIGNLEDVTYRAVRILGEVALVAAEDTRRSARLLRHYGIRTPTLSLHEHNERRRIPQILARLTAGDDIAYVTDAGTPAISDPGADFIRAAIDAGLTVTPVPGPSAIVAALVASGLDTGEFAFIGFPPHRSNDRNRWLERVAAEHRTLIFFEAPHRITRTLTAARDIWGDRQICVGREMTKKHEQWVRGPISIVLETLQQPRGEMTIIVESAPEPQAPRPELPQGRALIDEFGYLTNSGRRSRREAISSLASRYGIQAREIYSALERAKKSVE